MPITLHTNKHLHEQIAAKLKLGEATLLNGAIFILLYSNNTIKIDGVTYGTDKPFKFVRVKSDVIEMLRAIVQNTWLDQRTESLQEPTAAIVTINCLDDVTEIEYYVADEAREWVVADDNAKDLFESLIST